VIKVARTEDRLDHRAGSIPPKRNRTYKRDYAIDLWERNLIERVFNKARTAPHWRPDTKSSSLSRSR
jgi:hypothetical protein